MSLLNAALREHKAFAGWQFKRAHVVRSHVLFSNKIKIDPAGAKSFETFWRVERRSFNARAQWAALLVLPTIAPNC